ncbi:MAG: PQQ-dependent sugar dehydrogenase [Acidimicrobiia bacterium]|nr:PQQ-dependent sugar dehydrogenase [Acidimicrobiia bacterium]
MGAPQYTSPRRSTDLQVFILLIAVIILVAGAVTAVQAVTGDDTGGGDTTAADGGDTGDGGTTGGDTDGSSGGGSTDGAGSTGGDTGDTGDTGDGGTDAGDGGTATDLPPLQGLALETLVTELAGLTYATQPPGETDRLFVLQRSGRIFIVENDALVSDPPYLDLRDRVGANGIEQGLLGLDFHPEFETNGRFFVYYTDTGGRRQLSEFRASSADADQADRDTEKVLFEFEQPPRATEPRHYGGMVMFGPDGLLYVSLGDGANASDQGQNPETLFATIVRLDVDNGDPYAIPAGNPFEDGDGGRPEVWVWGVRNPWRFAIDPVENVMIVADVGLDFREEIDVLDLDTAAGANLGWPNVEGDVCFREADCDITDYHVPILAYAHDDGCSITGGHVYRGEAMPELHGHYFYTDWCAGWLRSFVQEDGAIIEEADWTEDIGRTAQINAFGIDNNGELYILTHSGTLARIVPVR